MVARARLSRRLPRGDGGPGQAADWGPPPPGAPELMDGGCPWGVQGGDNCPPPPLARPQPPTLAGRRDGRQSQAAATARGEAQRGAGGSDKPPAPPGNSSCAAVSQSHPEPPPLAQNQPPPSPEALGWRDLQMPPGSGWGGRGAVPWVGSPACSPSSPRCRTKGEGGPGTHACRRS